MTAYILDTNVIAEIAKAKPDEKVVAWIEATEQRRLHVTSTVLGEVARGIHRLPSGRKRRALELWFENALLRRFDRRILPFDGAAALIWGRLMGEGERQGRTPPDRDCQIAAVAIRHDMTVVTRNVRDFAALDLPTLNPWLG